MGARLDSRMDSRAAILAVGVALVFGCHEMHFEPRSVAGEIDIQDDLFAVSAPSADHVVAAGYWGAIYASQDRGRTWAKAETGTKHLVYDVSMADAKNGWAVGQLGMVLHTSDGGLTWQAQDNVKVAQGVHLFSVQALDVDRAWAVGEWGTRIYTEDGGRSWADHSLTIDETHPQFVWLSPPDQERVRRGEPVFEDVTLNDVHCLPEDRNRCWMIGEFGYIFRTESGGISPKDRGPAWERGQIVGGLRIDPIVMGYNEIELRDEHKRIIAELAKTIADQQHLNVAIEPRVTEQEIREFAGGTDPSPLFEIIEARTQEVQAVVEEAGILSDRIRRRGAPPWDWEEFIEEDPEFLERYLDGRRAGYPGVEVQVAQNPYLFSIRFADEFHGMISGLGGVILKTGDGGRTWEYEDVGRRQALFSIQPFSSQRAIVVGEKGFMRESNDGGLTWQTPGDFPVIFTFMRDLTFTSDRRIGYIVGQRGLVLRTEDGGKTWGQVLGGRGAEAAGLGSGKAAKPS